MPAGLLPQMGEGLGVSPALVGQLVTVYALGSLLAAIPLTLLTRGWRRRPLLLVAIGWLCPGQQRHRAIQPLRADPGGALFSPGYSPGCSGPCWRVTPAEWSPPHLQGRAIAVAMLGAPLALSLGVPAGTLLGTARWLALEFCDHDRADVGVTGLGALATPGLCRPSSATTPGAAPGDEVARVFVRCCG